MLAPSNVYVFEIDPRATKADVRHAVKKEFNVVPLKIRTVLTPAKKVFQRGKVGQKSAVKKAYVYIQEGQKLEK